MDISTIAQDVLELIAAAHGAVSVDLAAAERQIRVQLEQIGRAALQRHLDSHGNLGYQGSSRDCSCGNRQRFMGHRPRELQSMVGPVRLWRAYYHCASCRRGCCPYDLAAGLGAMALSPGLAKMACDLAVDLPFGKASAKLASLTGRRLSASSIERVAKQAGEVARELEEREARKILAHEPVSCAKATAGRLYVSVDGVMGPMRKAWEEIKLAECYWRDASGALHRRYVARTEKIDGFVPHAVATAARCGLEGCRECVLLADGSLWIWDRIAPAIDPDVKILDWYHAKEHLWSAGNIVFGQGTLACKTWVESLKEHLWHGRLDAVTNELAALHKTLRSPGKRQAVAELLTYLSNHRDELAYDRFRAQGLDIGSGLIESACKSVVQLRLKLPGARWKPDHAQQILSLRVCHLNGDWNDFWNSRPLAA